MENLSLRLVLDAPIGLRHGDDAKGWFQRTASRFLPEEFWEWVEFPERFGGCSAVRFGLFRQGGFQMHVLGREPCAVLIEAMGNLSTAWLREVGVAPNFQYVPVGLKVNPYLAPQRVSGVCLDNGASWKGAAFRYRDGEIPEASILQRVQHVVERGIGQQAGALLIEVPDDICIGDFKVFNIRIAHHRTGMAFLRVDADFRTNLSFAGPWHVGMCASKGWGRIGPPPRHECGRHRTEIMAAEAHA